MAVKSKYCTKNKGLKNMQKWVSGICEIFIKMSQKCIFTSGLCHFMLALIVSIMYRHHILNEAVHPCIDCDSVVFENWRWNNRSVSSVFWMQPVCFCLPSTYTSSSGNSCIYSFCCSSLNVRWVGLVVPTWADAWCITPCTWDHSPLLYFSSEVILLLTVVQFFVNVIRWLTGSKINFESCGFSRSTWVFTHLENFLWVI